ncbi:hypothetical protein B296_00018122 [Ensete ventricosum]|uniref:Uncharacterized protein n=1 Tax=Ensete ventricosum TaxID=4639 RepID=A0A426Y3K1_ENSVE|nr:hypothetical protein B296_00018122 [Ensete ventricosum]
MIGAMKLQLDDGPRSSLGIRPGSDDVVGPCWEFARRFAEGIGKLAGNTSGDRQKKSERLAVRMPEAVGLARRATVRPPVPWTQGGCQQLSAVEPPKSGSKRNEERGQPVGAVGARGRNRLQRDARKGLPPVASPQGPTTSGQPTRGYSPWPGLSLAGATASATRAAAP